MRPVDQRLGLTKSWKSRIYFFRTAKLQNPFYWVMPQYHHGSIPVIFKLFTLLPYMLKVDVLAHSHILYPTILNALFPMSLCITLESISIMVISSPLHFDMVSAEAVPPSTPPLESFYSGVPAPTPSTAPTHGDADSFGFGLKK